MVRTARQTMALAELERNVGEVWGRNPVVSRTGGGLSALHQGVAVGMETRRDPRTYQWDGMSRGGDAGYPQVVLQYTLEGAGHYDDATGSHRCVPGTLFAAIVPGAHRYYLPASSGRWRFFFVMFRHEYVVGRIRKRQEAGMGGGISAVWRVDAESLLVSAMVRLVEGTVRRSFREGLDVERALFDLLIEYERVGHALLHPAEERDRLLADVRAYVGEHLGETIKVEDLAARHKLSRSAFTHYFVNRTGKTPAGLVGEIRLEEVSRRLVGTNQTLAEIARGAGLADANHLCKVFRRKFHTSPGAFRRQMR